MNEAIRKISERLDLTSALTEAAKRNDLLPPREDDGVTGELGKRFNEHLRKALSEGKYQPDPASFVQVPKRRLTSRPAALLTLTDRVLYEALVDLIRTHVGKYLLDPGTVLWPRESYVEKRWQDFERAPLRSNHQYIVTADISGFYDSIDHEQLEDLLVQASGEREVAHAIREFLDCVMVTRRGVPQGLLPSDTLATLFLQPVDAALVREGFDYWRHGDDMRLAVPTVSRAREAIATLELVLREHGLLINDDKCSFAPRRKYQQELDASDDLLTRTREKLVARRVQELKNSEDELLEVMNRAELDAQLSWDLFYHHTVSVEDVIDLLREQLEPSDVDIAEEVFSETMRHAPGTRHAMSPQQFHQQLSRSMLRLAAGRSAVALDHASSLISRFPDKTELVAQYLMAVGKRHGAATTRQINELLTEDLFMTAWQKAWLCRVLARIARHSGKSIIDRLTRMANDEGEHWLTRAEAMKVLGRCGKLQGTLVSRSWKLAPKPYRCDLIAAVSPMCSTHHWAKRFLEVSRHDPVLAVVVTHVTQGKR